MRVPDRYREECGRCYGNGCFVCGNRGWHETDEGREARENEADRLYDERRDELD